MKPTEKFIILLAALLFAWWLGGEIRESFRRGNRAFVQVYDSIGRELSGEGLAQK